MFPVPRPSIPTPVQARKGEADGTPDDILAMVKAQCAPPHRLILFLQQSSVEWCSSLWMHIVQEVDPHFQRTGRRRGAGPAILRKADTATRVLPSPCLPNACCAHAEVRFDKACVSPSRTVSSQ